LVAWLLNPEAYLLHALMPRYNWSDEDLYKVTRYMTTKLTDPDLLSNVPKLDPPTPDEKKYGRRLFTEKGCGGCHVVKGINPQSEFGPDLSGLGSKTISQLEFGQSRTPRNLIAYIQAKIADPISVNPAACIIKHERRTEIPWDGKVNSAQFPTGVSSRRRIRSNLRTLQVLRLPPLQRVWRHAGS
jgi:hypothetical protein